MPEYHPAKFGGVWTTNKGETQRGTLCPSPQIAQPEKVKDLRKLKLLTNFDVNLISVLEGVIN